MKLALQVQTHTGRWETINTTDGPEENRVSMVAELLKLRDEWVCIGMFVGMKFRIYNKSGRKALVL